MSQPNTPKCESPKSVLEMARDTAFNAAKCKIADTTEAVKQTLVYAKDVMAEKASSATEAAKEALSNAVDFVKDTEKVKELLFYVFTKLCYLIHILIGYAKDVTAQKLSGIREAAKETLSSAAERTKQAACSSKDALVGKAEDLEEKDRDLGNASAENASEVPDKSKENAQELVDAAHERAENIKQAGQKIQEASERIKDESTR